MIALWTALALASPQDRYDAGLAALHAGDAPAAARAFTEALEQGGHDPAVYHGLGNALFRQGEVGLAIGAWRRGERLDPGNPDLLANITHAQQRAGHRIDAPRPATGPFFWLGSIAPSTLVWLAGSVGALGFGLLAAAARRRRLNGPQSWLVRSGVLALAVAAVLGLSSWAGAHRQSTFVITKPVTATSTPSSGGVALFELHPGNELLERETSAGHALVELPDGRKGWVPAATGVPTDPDDPLGPLHRE